MFTKLHSRKHQEGEGNDYCGSSIELKDEDRESRGARSDLHFESKTRWFLRCREKDSSYPISNRMFRVRVEKALD